MTEIVHGSNSTYSNLGCRCEACTRAHLEYSWRYRSNSDRCKTPDCSRPPSPTYGNGYCATCNRLEHTVDSWDGARVLRKALRSSDMTTHVQLAERMGSNPHYTSNVLRGVRTLSVAMALKFEDALGVDAATLLYLQVDRALERARERRQ